MAITNAQKERNLKLLTDVELHLDAVSKKLGGSEAIDDAQVKIFGMRHDSEVVNLEPSRLAEVIDSVVSKAKMNVSKEEDVQTNLKKSDVKRNLKWIDRRVEVFSDSEGKKNIKPVVSTATSNMKLLDDVYEKVDDISFDLGLGSNAFDEARKSLLDMKENKTLYDKEPREVVSSIKRVIAKSLNEMKNEGGMETKFEDSLAHERLDWLEQRLRVYSKSSGQRTVEPFKSRERALEELREAQTNAESRPSAPKTVSVSPQQMIADMIDAYNTFKNGFEESDRKNYEGLITRSIQALEEGNQTYTTVGTITRTIVQDVAQTLKITPGMNVHGEVMKDTLANITSIDSSTSMSSTRVDDLISGFKREHGVSSYKSNPERF